MVRQKFRMGASCRDLPKCSCLQVNTSPDKPLQYRALARSAMASPKGGRFGRTTSRASNSSPARSTIDIWETLLRETESRVLRSSCRGEPESDAYPRTIHSPFRSADLPQLHR